MVVRRLKVDRWEFTLECSMGAEDVYISARDRQGDFTFGETEGWACAHFDLPSAKVFRDALTAAIEDAEEKEA